MQGIQVPEAHADSPQAQSHGGCRVFSQTPHLDKEIVSHPGKVPWPKLSIGVAGSNGS